MIAFLVFMMLCLFGCNDDDDDERSEETILFGKIAYLHSSNRQGETWYIFFGDGLSKIFVKHPKVASLTILCWMGKGDSFLGK